MCDSTNYWKTKSNLVYLGRTPVNRRLRRQFLRVSLAEQRFIERATKKAIYKCCPIDIAKRTINGYYRSPTDPKSGEADFKKTDQPFHPLNRDFHYRKALRVVERIFRPTRRLKPIAFPDLRYYPWTLNTSAEAPYRESDRWYDHVKKKQREESQTCPLY